MTHALARPSRVAEAASIAELPFGRSDDAMQKAGASDYWRKAPADYAKFRPPLIPAASDVATFRRTIAGHDGHVLLLGVTPALAALGQRLTAIDNSDRMIETVWPGDREGRRALLGDWRRMPSDDAAYDAVIGDGVLCTLGLAVSDVLQEVRRVLKPGGVAVLRNFCAPERAESLDAVHADAMAGGVSDPYVLRWRIGMSLAWHDQDFLVAAPEMLHAFDRLFPDRHGLVARTGWAEDEVAIFDAYAQASHRCFFAPATRLLAMTRAMFASAEIVPAHGYPMAERCPFLVLRNTH